MRKFILILNVAGLLFIVALCGKDMPAANSEGNMSKDTISINTSSNTPSYTSSNETSSVDVSSVNTSITDDLQAQIDKLQEQINSLTKSSPSINSKVVQSSSQQSSSQEVSSAPQEPKIIPLNIVTKRGEGTLKFIKFETRPNLNKVTFYNEVIFYYETSEKKAKIPDSLKTFLYDKNGKKYTTDNFGGVGTTGDIRFQNIPDFSDLSTVTITYVFEDFDHVTVTFDIPGI